MLHGDKLRGHKFRRLTLSFWNTDLGGIISIDPGLWVRRSSPWGQAGIGGLVPREAYSVSFDKLRTCALRLGLGFCS